MKKDHFIRSWEGVTPFFYRFSRLLENKARKKSLELADLQKASSILVMAPPTEYFVDDLLAANTEGANHCVYFSEEMKKRGDARLTNMGAQSAMAERFDNLPYDNDFFDAVFAYCFLDFLEDAEIKSASREIYRILKPGGRLLATYLAAPKTVAERLTNFLFIHMRGLSKGVRVVDVAPVLEQAGFTQVMAMLCPQGGFPIGLAYAKK